MVVLATVVVVVGVGGGAGLGVAVCVGLLLLHQIQVRWCASASPSSSSSQDKDKDEGNDRPSEGNNCWCCCRWIPIPAPAPPPPVSIRTPPPATVLIEEDDEGRAAAAAPVAADNSNAAVVGAVQRTMPHSFCSLRHLLIVASLVVVVVEVSLGGRKRVKKEGKIGWRRWWWSVTDYRCIPAAVVCGAVAAPGPVGDEADVAAKECEGDQENGDEDVDRRRFRPASSVADAAGRQPALLFFTHTHIHVRWGHI